MSDSTKRSVRTAIHATIAAIAICALVLPFGLAALPAIPFAGKLGTVAAFFVAANGFVSKVWNVAEDRGLIPAWLKGADDVTVEVDDANAVLKAVHPDTP